MNKNINHYIFLIVLIFGLASCLPKPTETAALCGTNESFDLVTRSCFSTLKTVTVPTPTLSSLSLTQEVAQVVTLSYTDRTSALASSCQVSAVSSNVMMMSDSFAKTASAQFQATNQSMLDPYKCQCVGGVCQAVIVPIRGEVGIAGFTYTVTTANGTSAPQVVYASINALSKSTQHLRPVALSLSATGSESATSTPTPISFDLSNATVIDGFGSSSFTYHTVKSMKSGVVSGYSVSAVTYVDSDNSLGKITGCLGLGGSSLSSTTCHYYPNSGDTYSGSTPTKASVTYSDMTFTAKQVGSYGNNIKIYFKELSSSLTSIDPYSTTYEKFGLINGTLAGQKEIYTRVFGNNIYIFFKDGSIDSTSIKAIIDNDPGASLLVDVSLSGNSLQSSSNISPIALSNGVDGYDRFSFTATATNGSVSSTNTSTVSIDISSTEDPPVINQVVLGNSTFIEGSFPHDIDLSGTYTDVEDNVNTCDANDLLAQFSSVTCTCPTSSTCKITVDAPAKMSSTIPYIIQYRLCSQGLCTEYSNWTINITPVNDPPIIAITSVTQTLTENSTMSPSGANLSFTANSGNAYETQNLTMSVSSDKTVLFPPNTCTHYTPATSPPAISAINDKYYDTRNHICYYATSLTTWTMYPSLTIIPECTYTQWGYGTPVGIKTPGANGEYYLDVDNNRCYKSTGTTINSWTNDFPGDASTDIHTYNLIFIPAKNQSGSATISVTAQDNGGGTDSTTVTVPVTVTAVNDPPVFTKTITSVSGNESDEILAGPFSVDEDAGSTADEDVQAIAITNMTSSDSSIIPTSGISIFYDLNDNGVEDSGESRTLNQMLESNSNNDANAHNFYLKIKPVGGASGSANVTITASDGTSTVSTTFAVVVNPVSAAHGGWDNLTAVGIKTDKNGNPASSADLVCNYNTTADAHKCSGANCTGTATPVGLVVPDTANVLYWDSSNKKCYRSNGSTVYSWQEFKTICPITRVAGGDNLIDSSAPTTTTINQYYYNTSENKCYQSYQDGVIFKFDRVYMPSKITLTWRPFTLSSNGADMFDTIKGYNIYRRVTGTAYDFKTPLATITGTTTLTYTDTTANAGHVYYYVVRPVDTNHNLPTPTPEIFSEVRMFAPLANAAFVHRWMANQEICTKMLMTTTTSPNKIDPIHNFRCNYSGMGASGDYYDFGRDLLVDINEAGCAYTLNTSGGHCTVGSNGCIGLGAPDGQTSSQVEGDIYYDRSAGNCYKYASSAWNLTTAMSETALNPALVNISESNSATSCGARSLSKSDTELTNNITYRLPKKLDYMAYSAHALNLSDADINSLEAGDSLNIVSRCNSNYASGLAAYYSDSAMPSSSYLFTIAGTASSNIRSLYTGSVPYGLSLSTANCLSRYGIQDLYGNVAEWVSDAMTCGPDHTCPSSDSDWKLVDNSSYGLDLKSGPGNDTTGTGNPTTFLTTWAYQDLLYSATKFSFPMAMPFYSGITGGDFLLTIGSSSGITSSALHGDGLIMPDPLSITVSTNMHMAVGGSYKNGTMAGRYTTEIVKEGADELRPDIGFRCIAPIDNGLYPTDNFHPYKNQY